MRAALRAAEAEARKKIESDAARKVAEADAARARAESAFICAISASMPVNVASGRRNSTMSTHNSRP